MKDVETPQEDKNETPAQETAEGETNRAKTMLGKKKVAKGSKSQEALAADVLKKKANGYK